MLRVACLCPTYKRPHMLANALACFRSQRHAVKKLFVYDDAGQHAGMVSCDLDVIRETVWRPIVEKYAEMVRQALEWGADVLVPFEDDDGYHPDHLSVIADAVGKGVHFFQPSHVFSNYDLPKDGSLQIEETGGRFHASWAFTADAWHRLAQERRGRACLYGDPGDLMFDQKLGADLRRLMGGEPWPVDPPTYVYRWGSGGGYHGSQAGQSGFDFLSKQLQTWPAPYVGDLVPRFDAETVAIYSRWGFKVG